jgi:hypothetical protein
MSLDRPCWYWLLAYQVSSTSRVDLKLNHTWLPRSCGVASQILTSTLDNDYRPLRRLDDSSSVSTKGALPSSKVRRWPMRSDLCRANLDIVNLEGEVCEKPLDGM